MSGFPCCFHKCPSWGEGFRRALLVVVLAAMRLPLCAWAATATFPLHTQGQWIVDSNGVRIHLNAFNWYGAEGEDYVVEGLEAQPLATIVSTIKGLGFNAVRLPWSNQMAESNPVVGNYALAANASLEGENALTIFDAVVNALTGAGIMVILDNHMSNAGWCCSTTDNNALWYNAQYPESSWIANWQMMAARYQSNPMVIGVDLRNEPRSPATWGGNAADDWHAASERGGNAVLAVNPNLLIFVEGVNYAGDLSGVAGLPVQLDVANQLVYEAHDYGYWYSSGFTSYSNYLSTITPKWGYMVTGVNPQPLWIGEFGTCNTASTCVSSVNAANLGYWFQAMTSFVEQYGIDWSYWAINGTTETGSGGGFGTVETYGVLDTSWNAVSLPVLASRLQSMMSTGAAVNIVANSSALSIAITGGSATTTVAIVSAEGFSGSVSLSCSVSGPSEAVDAPQCVVPAMEPVSANMPASATVSISTTAAVASNAPTTAPKRGRKSEGAAGLALAGALLSFGRRRRKRGLFVPAVLLSLFASLMVTACGGGGSANAGGGAPGTTAGSYTVTVTATASGVSSASAQIGLSVE